MKRKLNVRILALAISLLLGTLPAVAAERPFALHGSGLSTFITNGDGIPIGANLTASGTATHLGLWSAVGTIQFTPDPNNPGLLQVSGSTTFTAANGDKLQTVLGTGVLDTSTGVGTGTLQFVGGTGRFAGASGTANLVVSQNLVTGTFEVTSVGRINY